MDFFVLFWRIIRSLSLEITLGFASLVIPLSRLIFIQAVSLPRLVLLLISCIHNVLEFFIKLIFIPEMEGIHWEMTCSLQESRSFLIWWLTISINEATFKAITVSWARLRCFYLSSALVRLDLRVTDNLSTRPMAKVLSFDLVPGHVAWIVRLSYWLGIFVFFFYFEILSSGEILLLHILVSHSSSDIIFFSFHGTSSRSIRDHLTRFIQIPKNVLSAEGCIKFSLLVLSICLNND